MLVKKFIKNDTFYHNRYKMVRQIVILIEKNKLHCIDFYLDGQFVKYFDTSFLVCAECMSVDRD